VTTLDDIRDYINLFDEFSEAVLCATIIEFNGKYLSSSEVSLPDRIDIRLNMQCLRDRSSPAIHPASVSVFLYDVSQMSFWVSRDPAHCLLINSVKVNRSSIESETGLTLFLLFEQELTDCCGSRNNEIRISCSSMRFCW
jgi:hypothetical protein